MEMGVTIMRKHILFFILLFGISNGQDFQDLSANKIPGLVEDIGSAIVMVFAQGHNYKDGRQGSGVVVNNGEYIITNAHVVHGARKAVIKFLDGSQQTFYGFSSEDSRRDLVSIKIKNKPNINSVRMRMSSTVKVGERVIAIGNPQGLSHSVSEGIISGKREFEKGENVLQTTAPISPGSSGGGLFDMDGKLLGITTFLRRGGQNLNFAYPSDYINSLLHHDDYHSFSGMDYRETSQSVSESVTVFVTRTGKKFHKSGCSYLRKSSIGVDYNEAKDRYSPCSRCFK